MATAELLALSKGLVDDTHGPVAATLISVLLQKGQLSARELSSLSKLPGSVVYRTLVSLVHLRLVKFHKDARNTIQYSACTENIYRIVWYGPLLSCVEEPLNEIIQHLLVHGHASLETLKSENNAAVYKLLSQRLVTRLHDFDFHSLEDLSQMAAQDPKRLYGSDARNIAMSEATRKAKIVEIQNSELQRLADLRDSGLNAPIEDSQMLCINFDEFIALERRKELVAFAARRVGPVTARVYEQVLVATARGQHSVSSSVLLDALRDQDLTQSFPDARESSKKSLAHGETSAQKRRKGENGSSLSIAQTTPEEDEGPKVSPRMLLQHMNILESCGIRFIQKISVNEWIPLQEEAVMDLRQHTFDEYVSNSFGPNAARIVRCVRKHQKLDEKQLSHMALLSMDEIRECTINLQACGFLNLQEVPKGNERAPSLNIYLWFHNPKWAYKCLVECLYKQMALHLDAIKELRVKHEVLLHKLTRIDVEGHEDSLLTALEQTELKTYKDEERAPLAQILACDRFVRIFREY